MSTHSSARVIAQIFLSAMDNAARACDRRDLRSQKFLEDLRDMLAPDLKWAHRYGEWPLDAAELEVDTAPDFVIDPADEEG